MAAPRGGRSPAPVRDEEDAEPRRGRSARGGRGKAAAKPEKAPARPRGCRARSATGQTAARRSANPRLRRGMTIKMVPTTAGTARCRTSCRSVSAAKTCYAAEMVKA